MKLNWTETGQTYSRVNTAVGTRGTFVISLDMPADRWALKLDGRRIIENVYYLPEAKRYAQEFEDRGCFDSALPKLC